MIRRSIATAMALVSITNGGCTTGSSSNASVQTVASANGTVGATQPGSSVGSLPSTGAPSSNPAVTPSTNPTLAVSHIAFSAANYSAKQSIGVFQITVGRTGGSTGSVTVHYSTTDGSAIAGTNYTATAGYVSWQDGDRADKILYVPISGSVPFSGNKSFTITLSDPTAPATLAAPSTTTVEIAGTQSTESISKWVTCDGKSNETLAVKQALYEAKNNAFKLIVDCPVRMHFTGTMTRSVEIADGTTIEFSGAGEIVVDDVSPPPFQLLHPKEVTLINWNVKYPAS